MIKNKILIKLGLFISFCVTVSLLILFPAQKAEASWDHHVGDVNWFGVVSEASASFYCDMGRTASQYAHTAQGSVYITDKKFGKQHYFDYYGAYCADCASGQDGGTGFCGCPWPNTNTRWISIACGLNRNGNTLLYSYVVNYNGKSAQDLYINSNVTSLNFEVPETREVVVHGELIDNPTYDITGKSLSDLFYNYGDNTLVYERTTPQDYGTDRKTIKGTVWSITCTRYYKVDIWGNVSTRAQETFKAVVSHNYEKTATYEAKAPTLTNEVYTPLNLNRGGYWGSKVTGNARYVTANDEKEWGIDYSNSTNVGKIDGYATNSQSVIENNSYIEGLDINSDTLFKLEFNNNCFGLDKNKNWANAPQVAKDEDYIMHAGQAYAKGYNGQIKPGDDRFRCNTQINGGVQDIGDQHLTSLYSYDYMPGEYVTGTDYETELSNTYYSQPNYANTFGVRAIAGGTFKTANFEENTNYKNCWTITWSQGRFYEYGIHYEGTITKNGISNPSAGKGYNGIITGQICEKGKPFSLYTDGMSHRGLYLKYASSNGETPLMVGRWRIKTIAGSATTSS